MPGYNFHITDIESIDILKHLSEGGLFAPVIALNRGYRLYNNLEEAIHDIGYNIHLALYSQEYTLYDPRVYSIYIKGTDIPNLHIGGPMIEIEIHKQHDFEGKKALGRGSIYYDNNYINPITGVSYKISDSVRCIYNDISRKIKRLVVKRYCISKAVRKGQLINISKTIWISKNALPEIEAGQLGVELQPKGWRSGNDITISPPI